jgi:hypothetical protein
VQAEEPRLLATGHRFHVHELPSGILRVTVWGRGSRTDVDELFNAYQPHLEQRSPALTLTDVTALDDLELSARWAFAERMRKNRQFVLRSAVIGLRPELEVVLRVLVRVSGRKDLRVFDRREDAEEWLLHARLR